MAPVQIAGATVTGTATSRTFAVTAASAAGDTLLAVISTNGTGCTVSALTDTQGNVYTPDGSFTSTAPLFYAFRSPGATGGSGSGATAALSTSDHFTATTSGSGNVELIGATAGAVGVLDVSSSVATGTSTTPSVSATPTVNNDTCVSGFVNANGGGSPAINSPFTSIGTWQSGSNAYNAMAYDALTGGSGTAQTSTLTIVSAAWRGIMWAFKPGSTPASVSGVTATMTLTATAGSVSSGALTPYTVAGGSTASGTTTCTVTVSHNAAVGDTLVIGAGCSGTGITVTGLADSQGNPYTQADSDYNQSTGIAAFVARISTALASGIDTITATYSGTTGAKTLNGRGCAGIAASSPVDVAISNDASTGTAMSVGPSSTLAQASEWAVAFSINGNGGGTPSSWTGGFTAQDVEAPASNQVQVVADQVVSSTAALTAGATIVTNHWAMLLVTLKAASGSASVTGVTAALALAAPAGSVSAGAVVAGVVAPLALAAPAGSAGAVTTVHGVTAPLALAAPAGSVTAGAKVTGVTAPLALAAPAGAAGVSAAPAFPAAPLGAKVELNLNGWTDVTGYVAFRKQIVSVVRGHADEATVTNPSSMALKLDNTSLNFSSKNPSGAWYGLIGRNTPVRVSIPEGASYLRLESDATSYAQCPDSAGVSITGDTEIHIDVTLGNWRANQVLAAKWAQTSNERSWLLTLNESGTLAFRWSPDGTNTNSVVAVSTLAAPWPGLRRQAIKVTLAVASGTVTFYTAPAAANQVTLGPITTGFVQLGTAVVVGADSVFNSTAPVQAGWAPDAAEYGVYAAVQGKIHAFTLISGIGGTTKASPNFTTQTAGATSFTDAQSNTWTLAGTAELSNRKYRAYMEASSWIPSSEGTLGRDLWMDVACSGILRRITQGTQTIGSVFYRAFTQVSPPDDLIGYWSLEDGNTTAAGGTPATPTQWASSVPGVPAGTFTSAVPGFASDSSFLCSQSIPTLNNSRWHFRLPSRATADTANVMRFLLDIPSGGDTDTGIIARMYTSGTLSSLTLQYGVLNGGSLQLLGYDQNGNQLFATGWINFGGLNGVPVWCSLELQTSGSSVQYSITILQPGAPAGLTFPATQASASIGNATSLVFQGDLGHALSGTAIGHVTYQAQWESLFDFATQLDAYQGEAAGQRFSRLCGEQGIPFRAVGSLDDTVAMGAQTPLSLSTLLQECVDTDLGQMFEPREALALGYRTRASMQNQATGTALNYSTDGLTGLMQPPEDDQYTKNDVVATRAYAAGGGTGSSAEVQATTGALSIQDPPDGVGEYIDSVTVNVQLDGQLPDQAGWRVHLGTVDEPRYPAIPFDLARQDIGARLYTVPDLDIGDRLTIGSTPGWEPPDGIAGLVNQATENIGERSYDIAWCTVPASPYDTGVVADPLFAEVDTDGSTLHASITSSATSLQIDTTAATPTYLWSTASGDRPFDILVGGERMTVTNLTGSSSPQSATVTRSVNGVVKAHSAGEAVTLFYPTIVSL